MPYVDGRPAPNDWFRIQAGLPPLTFELNGNPTGLNAQGLAPSMNAPIGGLAQPAPPPQQGPVIGGLAGQTYNQGGDLAAMANATRQQGYGTQNIPSMSGGVGVPAASNPTVAAPPPPQLDNFGRAAGAPATAVGGRGAPIGQTPAVPDMGRGIPGGSANPAGTPSVGTPQAPPMQNPVQQLQQTGYGVPFSPGFIPPQQFGQSGQMGGGLDLYGLLQQLLGGNQFGGQGYGTPRSSYGGPSAGYADYMAANPNFQYTPFNQTGGIQPFNPPMGGGQQQGGTQQMGAPGGYFGADSGMAINPQSGMAQGVQGNAFQMPGQSYQWGGGGGNQSMQTQMFNPMGGGQQGQQQQGMDLTQLLLMLLRGGGF